MSDPRKLTAHWQHYWLPAVRIARANGLQKNPRIYDLRHTHASWLIQDGVNLFTIARRLGHTSTRTTEQVYGHLCGRAVAQGIRYRPRGNPKRSGARS
ncbi:tyrosine-type recombinase/integrase [Arthrobacter sp. ISL-30]|uniref:tyrosine-type recombinase/integrase n=1 Tax=Arthrobacter sp. ISL-30 TaxID=2819109 RepID=UPI001BEBF8DB|nr:tyrosine-type recombinase/integrase [Arthrobacter sp. ISL-30]MBT2512203.1 tyrosine-type recombinase/integrase [Arthrobacter sp. ISL-30]